MQGAAQSDATPTAGGDALACVPCADYHLPCAASSPLQIFPFGFSRPDGKTIRGGNYANIVVAGGGQQYSWVNPCAACAFVHARGVVVPAR